MVDAGVIVPLSEDAKKEGIIDVSQFGKKSYKMRYRAEIVKKNQEYLKKFKPYCFTCAYKDLQEAQESKARSLNRIHMSDHFEVKLDLESYGKESHFKLLSVIDHPEEILLDGLKKEIVRKELYEYQCKARGFGLSMFTPLKVIRDVKE